MVVASNNLLFWLLHVSLTGSCPLCVHILRQACAPTHMHARLHIHTQCHKPVYRPVSMDMCTHTLVGKCLWAQTTTCVHSQMCIHLPTYTDVYFQTHADLYGTSYTFIYGHKPHTQKPLSKHTIMNTYPQVHTHRLTFPNKRVHTNICVHTCIPMYKHVHTIAHTQLVWTGIQFHTHKCSETGSTGVYRATHVSTHNHIHSLYTFPHSHICIHMHLHRCAHKHSQMHAPASTNVYKQTHINTHISTHTCVHTLIHLHTQSYIYVNLPTHAYPCVHTYTHVQSYMHIHMQRHVWTWLDICICIHTPKLVYASIYIQAHAWSHRDSHIHKQVSKHMNTCVNIATYILVQTMHMHLPTPAYKCTHICCHSCLHTLTRVHTDTFIDMEQHTHVFTHRVTCMEIRLHTRTFSHMHPYDCADTPHMCNCMCIHTLIGTLLYRCTHI